MMASFPQAVDLYRQGRFVDAERRLRAVLEAEPRHADALQLAGLLAMQRGAAVEALGYWRRSLAVNPRQPAVYLNMSTAELNMRRPLAALECCEAALALQPGNVDARNNRGAALLALNRPDDALASFEGALELKPELAVAHLNRGRTLKQLGREAEALACYDRAVHLRPDDVSIRTARGHLLMELLRPHDALADYERGCQSTPHDPVAWFNRGLALEMAQRFEAAIAAFDAAIARAPGFAQAHRHRGGALGAIGRNAEAFDSHSRAIAAQEGNADAWCGAGNALRELGRLEEALEHYDRALTLDPRHLDALSNRGRALLALRKPAEAVVAFERLFEIAPATAARHNHSLGHLLHARLCCCDWREYEPTAARITAAVLAGERVTLPSYLLVTSSNAAAQLACARLFVADNWAALGAGAPPVTGGADGRIRVAYVSADFRQHPVASLLVSLIETHDRARFEIVGVSLRPPDGSALGARIRAAFDQVIDTSQLSDAEAVALLRAMSIDIAVDLGGYTDGFRAGLFARRIAPVQVNFLGYTGTLGASYADYVLADAIVVPRGEEACFSERPARLPHCYLPGDARRPVVSQPKDRIAAGLPEHGFVFCCFNNHYKLNPRMFDVWMRMLQTVRGSVLWLACAGETIVRNLRDEAARRGVAPERLLFAARLPDNDAHLARLPAADLFLDTLPFNAHTTAADALWAGLPVLTCRGTTFAGRVGASLVTAAGLPELAVEDLAAYESLGISLASSPQALAAIRGKLTAGRATASLYDYHGYRRNLETAYSLMAERARRGLAPQTLQP